MKRDKILRRFLAVSLAGAMTVASPAAAMMVFADEAGSIEQDGSGSTGSAASDDAGSDQSDAAGDQDNVTDTQGSVGSTEVAQTTALTSAEASHHAAETGHIVNEEITTTVVSEVVSDKKDGNDPEADGQTEGTELDYINIETTVKEATTETVLVDGDGNIVTRTDEDGNKVAVKVNDEDVRQVEVVKNSDGSYTKLEDLSGAEVKTGSFKDVDTYYEAENGNYFLDNNGEYVAVSINEVEVDDLGDPMLNDEGEPVLDEDGKPKYNKKTETVSNIPEGATLYIKETGKQFEESEDGERYLVVGEDYQKLEVITVNTIVVNGETVYINDDEAATINGTDTNGYHLESIYSAGSGSDALIVTESDLKNLEDNEELKDLIKVDVNEETGEKKVSFVAQNGIYARDASGNEVFLTADQLNGVDAVPVNENNLELGYTVTIKVNGNDVVYTITEANQYIKEEAVAPVEGSTSLKKNAVGEEVVTLKERTQVYYDVYRKQYYIKDHWITVNGTVDEVKRYIYNNYYIYDYYISEGSTASYTVNNSKINISGNNTEVTYTDNGNGTYTVTVTNGNTDPQQGKGQVKTYIVNEDQLVITKAVEGKDAVYGYYPETGLYISNGIDHTSVDSNEVTTVETWEVYDGDTLLFEIDAKAKASLETAKYAKVEDKYVMVDDNKEVIRDTEGNVIYYNINTIHNIKYEKKITQYFTAKEYAKGQAEYTLKAPEPAEGETAAEDKKLTLYVNFWDGNVVVPEYKQVEQTVKNESGEDSVDENGNAITETVDSTDVNVELSEVKDTEGNVTGLKAVVRYRVIVGKDDEGNPVYQTKDGSDEVFTYTSEREIALSEFGESGVAMITLKAVPVISSTEKVGFDDAEVTVITDVKVPGSEAPSLIEKDLTEKIEEDEKLINYNHIDVRVPVKVVVDEKTINAKVTSAKVSQGEYTSAASNVTRKDNLAGNVEEIDFAKPRNGYFNNQGDLTIEADIEYKTGNKIPVETVTARWSSRDGKYVEAERSWRGETIQAHYENGQLVKGSEIEETASFTYKVRLLPVYAINECPNKDNNSRGFDYTISEQNIAQAIKEHIESNSLTVKTDEAVVDNESGAPGLDKVVTEESVSYLVDYKITVENSFKDVEGNDLDVTAPETLASTVEGVWVDAGSASEVPAAFDSVTDDTNNGVWNFAWNTDDLDIDPESKKFEVNSSTTIQGTWTFTPYYTVEYSYSLYPADMTVADGVRAAIAAKLPEKAEKLSAGELGDKVPSDILDENGNAATVTDEANKGIWTFYRWLPAPADVQISEQPVYEVENVSAYAALDESKVEPAAYDKATRKYTYVSEWRFSAVQSGSETTGGGGGGGTSSRPTTNIPETDVPLSPGIEEEIPETDVPLADGPVEEIPEGNVPLADIPDEEIPLADAPSDVAKTGDDMAAAAGAAGAAGLGMLAAARTLFRRRKEDK